MMLRYVKKYDEYRNKNGTLSINMDIGIARSYNWYIAALRVKTNTWILNTYPYSRTTQRHQNELRCFLKNNNKSIITIECPMGLQRITDSISYYKEKIDDVTAKLSSPSRRKSCDTKRLAEIAQLSSKLKEVEHAIEMLELAKYECDFNECIDSFLE